jgi:hypothetical protein
VIITTIIVIIIIIIIIIIVIVIMRHPTHLTKPTLLFKADPTGFFFLNIINTTFLLLRPCLCYPFLYRLFTTVLGSALSTPPTI